MKSNAACGDGFYVLSLALVRSNVLVVVRRGAWEGPRDIYLTVPEDFVAPDVIGLIFLGQVAWRRYAAGHIEALSLETAGVNASPTPRKSTTLGMRSAESTTRASPPAGAAVFAMAFKLFLWFVCGSNCGAAQEPHQAASRRYSR